MQCCHWGRRCPKTEGRCPDQKKSLSHGNRDSSQPLSQSHILMYSNLHHLPWDSIGYRLSLAVSSSMHRPFPTRENGCELTGQRLPSHPCLHRTLITEGLAKKETATGTPGTLPPPRHWATEPQFVNSGVVLAQKFLGSKRLLPCPRTWNGRFWGPSAVHSENCPG